MAPVLQCPDCGTKHPIDVASSAAAFRCNGCGRTLKVPEQFRSAAAPAVAPDPAAHDLHGRGGTGASGVRERWSHPLSPQGPGAGGRGSVLDAIAHLDRRGARRLHRRVRSWPGRSASSRSRNSRTCSSRPVGTGSGRSHASCRSPRCSPRASCSSRCCTSRGGACGTRSGRCSLTRLPNSGRSTTATGAPGSSDAHTPSA